MRITSDKFDYYIKLYKDETFTQSELIKLEEAVGILIHKDDVLRYVQSHNLPETDKIFKPEDGMDSSVIWCAEIDVYLYKREDNWYLMKDWDIEKKPKISISSTSYYIFDGFDNLIDHIKNKDYKYKSF